MEKKVTCPGTVPREVLEEAMEVVGMVMMVAEEDMEVAENVVVEEVAFNVEKQITCPGTVPREEVVEEAMEVMEYVATEVRVVKVEEVVVDMVEMEVYGVGMVMKVAEKDMGVVQEATKAAEMVVVEEVAFNVEK